MAAHCEVAGSQLEWNIADSFHHLPLMLFGGGVQCHSPTKYGLNSAGRNLDLSASILTLSESAR